MAIPTPLNGMITDAVTQSNVSVLGSAPANAMAAVYQSLAHSTGILHQNAVLQQSQLAMASQAATVQGIKAMYGPTTMAGAVATQKVSTSSTADNLLTMLVALKAFK